MRRGALMSCLRTGQEHCGFKDIHTFLQRLPEPVLKKNHCMTYAAAIKARRTLTPLFLAGNSTPTIPHKFSKRKDSGLQMVGEAAMSMRLICGCGSLDSANPAWWSDHQANFY